MTTKKQKTIENNYEVGDKVGIVTLLQEVKSTIGARSFISACRCRNITLVTLFGKELDDPEHAGCPICLERIRYAKAIWECFKIEYKKQPPELLEKHIKAKAEIGDFFDNTKGIGFTPFPRTLIVYFEPDYKGRSATKKIAVEENPELWMPVITKMVGSTTYVWFTPFLASEAWMHCIVQR